MSKKWDSKPALDEHGKPLLNANGKTVLRKSYSVLQDDFFAAMRKAGHDDVERGERGSSEEHLTVTQFKVQQEQARLESIEDTIDRRKQTLEKYNEKIREHLRQYLHDAAGRAVSQEACQGGSRFSRADRRFEE